MTRSVHPIAARFNQSSGQGLPAKPAKPSDWEIDRVECDFMTGRSARGWPVSRLGGRDPCQLRRASEAWASLSPGKRNQQKDLITRKALLQKSNRVIVFLDYSNPAYHCQHHIAFRVQQAPGFGISKEKRKKKSVFLSRVVEPWKLRHWPCSHVVVPALPSTPNLDIGPTIPMATKLTLNSTPGERR